jgi:hypothetical protein
MRVYSDHERIVRHLYFFPNKNGRFFDFKLDSLPKFKNPQTINKELIFISNGNQDTLITSINKTIIDAVNDFPLLKVKEYFKLGLSKESSGPIIAFFLDKFKNMNDSASVRYLLSFIRTGFTYEDDSVSYKMEKPMIAEEVLYYPTVDCEDKSALFFQLIKMLLNIDILALDYPRHVNIAVLLNKSYGTPFVYRKKQYSICETNSSGDDENKGIGYSFMEAIPNVIFEYHPSIR